MLRVFLSKINKFLKIRVLGGANSNAHIDIIYQFLLWAYMCGSSRLID